MPPWEKRLKDLWLLLEHCHTTYMEPELFRLNTNQFLQTSRTVTFIIQKHKTSIPNFDEWYQQAVIADWSSDAVMVWAKDSRNKIEKEGDLELHSTLELTLLFSYLVEQDIKLATGRTELLQAGIKKLVRFAQKHLPSHVIPSSAVKIERKWVANSLPSWELLQAMNYIYTTLYRTCQTLANHLSTKIDSTIPDPTDLYAMREVVRHVCYVKLSDLKLYYPNTKRIYADSSYSPPVAMGKVIYDLREKMSSANSTEKMHAVLVEMAERTFEHDGYHIPMLSLLDKNFKHVDGMSVHFRDSVDKYIFWRNVADRVIANKAIIITWVCEAWIRDMKFYSPMPLKNLPIIGEILSVTALDNTGKFLSASWEIVRADEASKPTLKRLPRDEEFLEKIPFYFAPSLHAFGIPYPDYFDKGLMR